MKRVVAVAPVALDQIQLWAVALDEPRDEWPSLLARLSLDERIRAGRFRFDRDRRRFVKARAALREILGDSVGLPAHEIAFEYGPYGKPSLANTAAADIEFNLSHCQGLALIVVSAGRRVGVDLERISHREAEERMQIAERFFSSMEVAALRGLPAGLVDEAFFACWTRKEAYLKARGEGLSIPLDAFSVSLAPGEPAAFVDLPTSPDGVRNWSLHSLTPAPGFIAALAVEGEDWRLSRQEAPIGFPNTITPCPDPGGVTCRDGSEPVAQVGAAAPAPGPGDVRLGERIRR